MAYAIPSPTIRIHVPVKAAFLDLLAILLACAIPVPAKMGARAPLKLITPSPARASLVFWEQIVAIRHQLVHILGLPGNNVLIQEQVAG